MGNLLKVQIAMLLIETLLIDVEILQFYDSVKLVERLFGKFI